MFHHTTLLEHPDGLLASACLPFGGLPATSSALEISRQVFVPATFEERPGLYAFVTNLTDSRLIQRPVALFYETDGKSWSLVTPATFLSSVEQRHQLELQQQSQAQALLLADYEDLTKQYNTVHGELAASHCKHLNLAEHISKLETTAEQASQHASDRHAQLQLDLEAETAKSAAATVKMTKQGQGLIDALWTAAGLRKELAGNNARMLDLNHEITALRAEAHAATQAQHAASTALRDMLSSHAQLQVAHQRQLQAADDSASALSDLRSQTDSLHRQLEAAQQECSLEAERADAAERDHAASQEGHASLQGQLAASQAGLDGFHVRLHEQDQQLSQANTTINDMHEAAHNLRSQLNDAHQHIYWLRETHETSLQVSSHFTHETVTSCLCQGVLGIQPPSSCSTTLNPWP